jgi:hypothetical protein
MDSTSPPSPAIATIAAMITPALLIVGATSLVTTALARMARIVDRARVLASLLHGGQSATIGATPELLRGWLAAHAVRALYAERSIATLYAAVVVFVTTCLTIAMDRLLGGGLGWLSIVLAVLGTCLLLGGGGWMLVETRLGSRQIQDEIRHALITGSPKNGESQ